jgi:hypothetical protein
MNAAGNKVILPRMDTPNGIYIGGRGQVSNVGSTNAFDLVASDGTTVLATIAPNTYVFFNLTANNTANGTLQIQTASATAIAKPLGGRLTFNAATLLVFAPYGGDWVRINGVLYQMLGSISISNTSVKLNGTPGSNLAINSLYLVGLSWSGSALVPEFWALPAAGHVTGGDGTEYITGGPPINTVSLIGMVRTNGSAQFQDDTTFRGVASWFNRRRRAITGSIANGSSNNTGGVTLGNGPYFLTWGDLVDLFFESYAYNSVSGNYGILQIKDDQNTVAIQATNFADSITNTNVWTSHTAYTPSEGFRGTTLIGISQSGSNTYSFNNNTIFGATNI